MPSTSEWTPVQRRRRRHKCRRRADTPSTTSPAPPRPGLRCHNPGVLCPMVCALNILRFVPALLGFCRQRARSEVRPDHRQFMDDLVALLERPGGCSDIANLSELGASFEVLRSALKSTTGELQDAGEILVALLDCVCDATGGECFNCFCFGHASIYKSSTSPVTPRAIPPLIYTTQTHLSTTQHRIHH
jgi:hypothetical protein